VNPTKIGHYEIQAEIGRGGMGVVFRAYDPLFEEIVAVKTMSAEYSADPTFRKRFIHEGRSLRKLIHANIVEIKHLGEDDGLLYLCMEFLEGRHLGAELANQQEIPLERKLSLMIDICKGLSHAHSKGILHRDITPKNVFVTEAGGVKILDFGLARELSSDSVVTATMGTPNYMPPEQWNRNAVLDDRTDIFALGAVFYELLTQRKAFPGRTQEQVWHEIMHVDPEPVSKVDPRIPQEISALVQKALAKEPPDRFQRVLECIHELDECVRSLERLKQLLRDKVGKSSVRLGALVEENRHLFREGTPEHEYLREFLPSALQACSPPDRLGLTPALEYFALLSATDRLQEAERWLVGIVARQKQPYAAEEADWSRTEIGREAVETANRCTPGDVGAGGPESEDLAAPKLPVQPARDVAGNDRIQAQGSESAMLSSVEADSVSPVPREPLSEVQRRRGRPVSLMAAGAALVLAIALWGGLWARDLYVVARFGREANDLFVKGQYREADAILGSWLSQYPGDPRALDLAEKVRGIRAGLEQVRASTERGSYGDALRAIQELKRMNPSDPEQKLRLERLDATFGAEFGVTFTAESVAKLWESPPSWGVDESRRRLIVRGSDLGWVRNRHWKNFNAHFDLQFLNGKGASWLVRVGDAANYYAFRLCGSKGRAPNTFEAWKCLGGQLQLLDSKEVGKDLGRPGDSFNISIEAKDATITHWIEIASLAQPEPIKIGVLSGVTIPGGTFGFRSLDGEEFTVSGFQIDRDASAVPPSPTR
jgi:tetratricopeptide (TPR) repeat protein